MSSLQLFDIGRTISNLGFITTIIVNIFLIYLTIWRVKRIVGTYRKLVVISAQIGLLFSIVDYIIHPYFYSFDNGLIYFSLENLNGASNLILDFFLLLYSGMFSTMVCFMTVQYIYRYMILNSDPKVKYFKGCRFLIFIGYCLVWGVFHVGGIWFYGSPDNESKDYFRETMIEKYNVNIDDISSFMVVVFTSSNEIRWRSVLCAGGIVINLTTQYSLMLVIGIRMHLILRHNLNSFSETHRKLQKQFFTTLVLQISAPSLTFHIPMILILVAPYVHLKISFETGLIIPFFSFYPSIDSVIQIFCVTEYRHSMKKLVDDMMLTSNDRSAAIQLRYL
ncbi:unnamed protein product [Caenorhabditis angaria]|uniref:Seven TM Receptor n=1 Tax=Caenorhabditis angaria TaxID=860376 RepID=A0A9P1IVJ0_9PELO|nr:unnamed protein product [Caenorhabditis angaria]